MGEGRALDPDHLGQLLVGIGPLGLQREQDQPYRARAAGLRQRVVEGATDALSGAGQSQPDRLLKGRPGLLRRGAGPGPRSGSGSGTGSGTGSGSGSGTPTGTGSGTGT